MIKKSLLIVTKHYFREQHKLQQEQRKAARSAKAQKEAPKEEIGVQLKKKAPAQKEAAAPDAKRSS